MFKLVVLSVALAAAAANPISIWRVGSTTPLASSWATPLAGGIAGQLASPIFTSFVAPAGLVAPIGEQNYRGPLSLAPGQPANILAADGRPLDTQSVNLDRAVHYNAKAFEENSRRLQKRSIVVANLAVPNLASANLASNLATTNLASGPLAAGSLTASPLDVTLLTSGRSWVSPAPIAIAATGSISPLGFQVGAGVGNF